MKSEQLFYSPALDQLLVMTAYSDDDNAVWVFEFEDGVESWTFDIAAALATIVQFEQIGDL